MALQTGDAEHTLADGEGDGKWNAWWATLVWRPIAEYDRTSGTPQLLRNGDDCALGFWGTRAEYLRFASPDPADSLLIWRHAQESRDESALGFDPWEFAELTDEWRTHLMAD